MELRNSLTLNHHQVSWIRLPVQVRWILALRLGIEQGVVMLVGVAEGKGLPN
jgi:hypothetical protein